MIELLNAFRINLELFVELYLDFRMEIRRLCRSKATECWSKMQPIYAFGVHVSLGSAYLA